ncbi:MAG: hypothetical protein H7228_10545 [Polaromonas sp.]|nr:hypothetical protein [Polaromonas sp.]
MPESSLKNWDKLLREGLVSPPADFHARVMDKVADVPQLAHLPLPAQPARLRLAAQALGLAAAAIAGLTQLVIFSFGIWSATAAG